MAAGDKTGVHWRRRALPVHLWRGLAVAGAVAVAPLRMPATERRRRGAVVRMVRGYWGFGVDVSGAAGTVRGLD